MYRNKRRTLQSKLFWVLSLSIIVIVLLFILINSFIYKPFYIYSKQLNLKNIYKEINQFDFENNKEQAMFELEKIAAKNGIEIVLKDGEGKLIYSSNKDFLSNIELQNNTENSFMYFSYKNDG